MSNPLDIVTEIPASFLEEFEANFQKTVPAEKVRADLNQAFIGRALIAEGAQCIEGIGQRMGEVDARTYFRWAQAEKGFWNDPANVREFFADNAHLRDKGYNPKVNQARHGMTYVDGKPVR